MTVYGLGNYHAEFSLFQKVVLAVENQAFFLAAFQEFFCFPLEFQSFWLTQEFLRFFR